jgi:hypothetical protein
MSPESEKRFFSFKDPALSVDEGAIYHVVATDLAHARLILRDADRELREDDDRPPLIGHCWIDDMVGREILVEDAVSIRVWLGDDEESTLAACVIGDWFCS